MTKLIRIVREYFMRVSIFFLILATLIFSGCRYSSTSYQITDEGVFNKSNIITHFSISQFKMDHQDLNDIRPIEHTELMRYCCELKINQKGDKKILFKNNNSDYQWSLCKLDTSLVANDSLNALSFNDKLKYIRTRDSLSDKHNGDMQLPFALQKGYVYQIFGLPDLDGSYYFCLNSDDRLIVQFFDKGPW